MERKRVAGGAGEGVLLSLRGEEEGPKAPETVEVVVVLMVGGLRKGSLGEISAVVVDMEAESVREGRWREEEGGGGKAARDPVAWRGEESIPEKVKTAMRRWWRISSCSPTIGYGYPLPLPAYSDDDEEDEDGKTLRILFSGVMTSASLRPAS